MDELNFGICSLVVTRGGEAPVVFLSGELDISSADAVRTALDDALPSSTGPVVFDLAKLRFMDSSGLAVMLSIAERAGGVELRHPSPIVQRIIEATGLAGVLRQAT